VGWLHTCGDDHIHVEADEFLGEAGKPFSLGIRIPPFDRDILSLDVSKLAQHLTESLDAAGVDGRGGNAREPEPRNFRGLRLGAERRGEDSHHSSKKRSPAGHW
jgi:hypothetical protein